MAHLQRDIDPASYADWPIEYTFHAQKRMRRRFLTREEVERTIRTPTQIRKTASHGPHERFQAEKRPSRLLVCVIFDRNEKRRVIEVVSAWTER